jgi:hypothetical protein
LFKDYPPDFVRRQPYLLQEAGILVSVKGYSKYARPGVNSHGRREFREIKFRAFEPFPNIGL